MKLIHLKNKKIDRLLWDEKIELSAGNLPYAQSWFLDIVSPKWEAIVSENYEYIMPLPVKEKFKIGYLVQPLYTQQLGIFSEQAPTPEIIELFLAKIPYLSYQFNLNENNKLTSAIEQPNFVLSLNKSYNEIAKEYSKNSQRNIEKAIKSKLIIEEIFNHNEVINFINNSIDVQPVKPNKIIELIVSKGLKLNNIKCIGAKNSSGELIANACFLKTKSRFVYLYPVSNEEGKKSSAMFAIIDSFIRNYADNELVLDFEGSRFEGIARFYKGFGAQNKPYYMVKKYRPDFLTGKF